MIIPASFYDQIVKSMPIPCIDLLITKPDQSILLVQRTNEPARGKWWFPGGRVHLGETRQNAAIRKLREECQLEAHTGPKELMTQDLIFHQSDGSVIHSISTVFDVSVAAEAKVTLDAQSAAYKWGSATYWKNQGPLDAFIIQSLELKFTDTNGHL